MKKKIFVSISIFAVILCAVLAVVTRKSTHKSAGMEENSLDNNLVSKEKQYNSEGLLIVSADTYPELFELKRYKTDSITRLSGELFISYYETEYVDENGETICQDLRRISIFDEKLAEAKDIICKNSALCYEGKTIEEKSERKEMYSLDFLSKKANEAINEPYELIYPEKYNYNGQLQKIDSYGELYEVKNVKKIIYPANIASVNIYGCFDLEKIECPARIKGCSINKCPRLEVEVGIAEDSDLLMCANVCSECKLKSFYIPKSVAVIDGSFNNCQSFEEYSINEGVIMLTSSFNYNSYLKKVYVPDSAIIIKDCFLDCENLVLSVGKATAAEEYAIKNGIKYIYH